MEIDLYAILVKAGASEEDARKVVDGLKQYITMEIARSNQLVVEKLDSIRNDLGTKIDAMRTINEDREKVDAKAKAERERRSQLARWVVTTAIAVAGLTFGALKALGYLH